MIFPDAPKGYVSVEAYEELKQKNARLEQTIALLVARIEDLERRLSLEQQQQ